MNVRGFVVNDTIINREEVQKAIVKDGSSSIGRLVIVCLYLMKHFNAIGCLDDLKIISGTLHTKETCLRRWLSDCGIFSVDMENGLFTYGYLRHMFGLEDEITEREVYLVKTYGNSIRRDPEADAGDDGAKCEIPDNKPISDDDDMDNKSESDKVVIDNVKDEKTDGEVVSAPSNSNTNISNHINSNIFTKTKNMNINMGAVGGDAESSFKIFEAKIFYDKPWRHAMTISHGINLDDDKTMHIFTKWMYEYCIAKSKRVSKRERIMYYASNLLLKSQRTRRMFEDYLHSELEEKRRAAEDRRRAREAEMHPQCVNKAQYEYLKNGVRIGLDGQVLPKEAPLQTDFNWRWSYREHRYVDVSEWDREAEMKCYNEVGIVDDAAEDCGGGRSAAGRRRNVDDAAESAGGDTVGQRPVEVEVMSLEEIIKNNILPNLKDNNYLEELKNDKY